MIMTTQSRKELKSKLINVLEFHLLLHQVSYSEPQFVLDNLPPSVLAVISKYKILITCSDIIDSTIDNTKWRIMEFSESQLLNNAEDCVSEIKRMIHSVHLARLKPKFTFIDLFAGIGGFRIALEELGGECLAFSEIDKQAISTYKSNFIDPMYDKEKELGDITKVKKLPFNIDLVVGGVPCQSWSVAGNMKGFDDPRGKLWEDAIRIVYENQPKAFIFENVKGLKDPRNKKNLDLILVRLNEAGYNVVEPQLLNSYDFGVPQNRDRVFIVGFRKDLNVSNFKYPNALNLNLTISEILDFDRQEDLVKKNLISPKELHGDAIPFSRNRFQKIDELNDFFVFCDTRNGHTSIHSWDLIETTNKEKQICLAILKNRRKKKYGSLDGNPMSLSDIGYFVPNLSEMDMENLILKNIIKRNKVGKYVLVNSKNSSGINGIYRVYLPHSKIFSTLTATGTKDMVALKSIEASTVVDYKDQFIKNVYKKNAFRPLTERETGRLQGFPYWFNVNRNENFAKKQFGNAVSVPVVYNLGKSLINTGIFEI